jgi:mono/diheme cytochrome c family protein
MIHRLVPLFLAISLSALAQDGGQLFSLYCSACHGADGKGAGAGAFPPLAGSPWVTGDGERAIKIILKGLHGPVEVLGKTYNLEMPPQGAMLPDDQIAAILTYVRSSWGNQAAPVTPEQVKSVRASTQSRSEMWTAAELLKLHPLPQEKTALKDIISLVYQGDWQKMPDFSKLKPTTAEEEPKSVISLANAPLKDGFAMTWDGKFEAPTAGVYSFILDADDAANLLINGKRVTTVSGIGPMGNGRAKQGKITLQKGDHVFRVEYLEVNGEEGLAIGWRGPGVQSWQWLTDDRTDESAQWPEIPIEPTANRAAIYRNFIKGTTPRAIGIGFPGGVNLAYSADHLAPELIWTGKFMDGGRHWTDRGVGAEPPAGENVVTLSGVRALPDTARFKGYKLDPAGNPTFSVQLGTQFLLDSWKPSNKALIRTIRLNGNGPGVEILVSDRPLDGEISLTAEPAALQTSGTKTTLKLAPGQPATLTYRWK